MIAVAETRKGFRWKGLQLIIRVDSQSPESKSRRKKNNSKTSKDPATTHLNRGSRPRISRMKNCIIQKNVTTHFEWKWWHNCVTTFNQSNRWASEFLRALIPRSQFYWYITPQAVSCRWGLRSLTILTDPKGHLANHYESRYVAHFDLSIISIWCQSVNTCCQSSAIGCYRL